jgi:transposase
VILAAAAGQSTIQIARSQRMRPATVSNWRVRFAQSGLNGLQDAPRPGAVPRYTETTEHRILAKLDEAPPSGYATWTGSLVAEAPGDVSKHQVWPVLRAEGIYLRRRRNWCISTDPQFAVKDVGLYLNPPENAVICRLTRNRISRRWSERRDI